MRKRFPRKKPGDSLEAVHVNDLSGVARKFDKMTGRGGIHVRHGESFVSVEGWRQWDQVVFEVTNTKIDGSDLDDSGLYLGKARWYSASSDRWQIDDGEFEPVLDARGLDIRLAVEDKVVAYWDEQRGAFVPIVHKSDCKPLVDYRDSVAGGIATTATPNSDIRFELEISPNGYSNWQVVNDRVYTVNGNVDYGTGHVAHVSGCGIYTFLVTGGAYLRVRVASGLDDATVSVANVVLRLEAKCGEGVQHSLGVPFPVGTVIPLWFSEAEVNNNGLSYGWPVFDALGLARVVTPAGESWTIEAELCLMFELTELESSSSPSSYSPGSSSSSSTVASETSSSSTMYSSESSSSTFASETSSSSTYALESSSSSSSGGCDLCEEGTESDTMYVTISGVGEKSPPMCGSCGSWNQKWALTRVGPCHWECTSGLPCDGTKIVLGISIGGDGIISFEVDVYEVNNYIGYWGKEIVGETQIDCSSVPLPLWRDSLTPPVLCDFSSSSALVTNI